ncbi:GNAT family N-acetyltransferase [Gayadomonas joobiniege]|uniref:GNAT family N-acetyltransferase n=1 Tax=Gayadomonas joobiniege TaxID=1234606 RepID=UPI00035F17B5|nr:GNAT family N-acetyltransferase [Gayadomonas joobiniege]
MVVAVDQNNLDLLLPLIHQYQKFYGIKGVTEEKNREFFLQFGKNKATGCQFMYLVEDKPVAFATVYFSFASTIPGRVAILNDLYTIPSHRNNGYAKRLIFHCRAYAKDQGAARLQWVTAISNKSAQKFYDKLNSQKSHWLFYTL